LAEVIRCSEEYAIIDAGDDYSAYLLRKGKSTKNFKTFTTFYLYAKFNYSKDKVKIKPSVSADEATVGGGRSAIRSTEQISFLKVEETISYHSKT